MSEQKWIYKLSDYQVGCLGNLFKYQDAPAPHNIQVENIGLIEGGLMIVDYIRYGELKRQFYPRIPENKQTEPIKL